MPLSSPDGYLDFTNAVPRAVKMVATSNVGIGTSSPKYALDVHGTSNTGPLTVSSLTIADGAIVGDVSISGNLALTSNVTTTVDSNVVVEHKGPHGRGAAVLKKFPEIDFGEGKFDANDSTSPEYFIQSGYKVTASGSFQDIYYPWRAFDGLHNHPTGQTGWYTRNVGGNYNPNYNGSPVINLGTASGGTATVNGEYLTLEIPNKICLKKYTLYGPNQEVEFPADWTLYGSNDGTTWTSIDSQTGQVIGNGTSSTPGSGSGKSKSYSIVNTTYYDRYAIVVTKINSSGWYYFGFQGLELYGYEEDPPAGDSSIDTTFTSVMNTPQTTGANVYVDGNLGETFTNRVTGPTPTGTATTYNETGKYWELTGALTSNVTLESNTFLEGDQPHAVSVWFNSSNLEANVSNTCVFSIASEEKLDSVNLDLQSNTWHNLTYAYQGEGGSRVTYLDGRKVSEDQAEDTFGAYPPFAMTGYSQGGYVVSASNEDVADTYFAWKVFDDGTGSIPQVGWFSDQLGNYNGTNGTVTTTSTVRLAPETEKGEWLQLEFPYFFHLDFFTIFSQSDSQTTHTVDNLIVYAKKGLSDTWTSLGTFTGIAARQSASGVSEAVNANEMYKYFAIVVTKRYAPHSTDGVTIRELKYYGHRENDLVRLPDPTRVLKYPHIAMTGPGQRGYVVSVSDVTSDAPGWYAFDGVSTTRWRGSGGQYTSGDANNTVQLSSSSNTPNGSWIKVEFPHKLKINKMRISGATTQSPKDGELWASNNDSDWTQIFTFSNMANGSAGNFTDFNFTPLSSDSFKYFALIVTKTGATNETLTSIYELEYYGTGVDSIPIQIGGGNIDRVANFRVYDKFVEEDQALEIWDAQKDEFGRAKSSMTLHKGRLGLGTEEPEGRLAVADEPDPDAYGLQEFPPKPLVGYKTHIEGHGEFCVSSSSEHEEGEYYGWHAFDKNHQSTAEHESNWISEYDPVGYDSSGNATGNNGVLNGVYGDYLILESPYKIKMSHVLIYPRVHTSTAVSYSLPPKDGKIWGRNTLDEPWSEIASYTNLTYGATRADNLYGQKPTRFDINASQYYKFIAFQITATNITYAGGTYTNYANLKELRYFGYREQVMKQSVLHDGQLTLTKNLNVPRIGPALDADDTPRRDRLVVEYNTSTNPTFEGAVRDTSGRGNDGVFVGTASYNGSEKALVFDGNSDYVVSGDLGIPSGAFVHSVSLWCKRDSQGSNMYLSSIGGENDATLTSRFSMMLLANAGTIHLSISGSNSTFTGDITTGSWFHIVYTYNGGAQGSSSTAHTVYVNGIEKPINGGVNAMTLNLPENSRVALGSQPWGGSNYFDGSISNFKLYDKILTAEEVKTLYDMGRCDEGQHVVNFSKTRVGIGLGDGEAPRSALDVRDLIYAESSTVETFTGQHKCVPEEPVEKGLIVSAKKNRFVKLNGGLDTGKSAITIDESLPVVSLSSVAKDKACFGVVSSMEEANSLVRVETVGGVISDAPKTLGDNRAIVNSVGEGAIWVVNTGGSLESGDYITTSNLVGYGQKQDDDVLHNYTVAKITMDCDFTATEVPLQVIKREETGLRTITEDEWNTLVDYDRSSTTETQYSNTLEPEAYTDQPGYTPREVTTIVDYTDGTNTISVEEWSALSPEVQETYQSNTTTEIVEYIKFVTAEEWSSMDPEVQATYTEVEIITYYQIMRGENILDENGQLQWEDKTGATEAPYERRFLDADGVETDEANAVHIAAFVGCTYHCG